MLRKLNRIYPVVCIILTCSCHELTECAGGDLTCNPIAILTRLAAPPVVGALGPLYTSSPDLNDYIDNDGTTFLNATGTTCNLTGNGIGTCLHSGLIRTANLTGSGGSCHDFSIKDSLDALQWYCDQSTGSMRAVSAGLKPGVPLSTLIDFDTGSFKPLRVIVTSGGILSSSSAAAVLWNNPIVIDNDGFTAGVAVSGNVYLITQNPDSIYVIDSDRVALLIKPGITMTGSVALNENLIQSNSANHIWLEGSIDLTGDDYAIRFSDTSFSVIRNVAVQNCTTSGNLINLTVNSRSNYVGDLRLTDTINCPGLQIDNNSSYNIFERLIFSNGATNQIRQQTNSIRNTFLDLTAFGTIGNNIGNIGVADLAVLNATLVASGSRGFSGTGAGDRMLFQNIATLNHAYHGFEINTPSNNSIINLATAHNTNNGIEINGSNNQFRGVLKVGNNDGINCNITGGTNPGIIITTCTDSGANGSSTYTGQSSNAILSTGVHLAASFIGPLDSEDLSNPSDAGGLQNYDSIGNWLDFDNRYRAWARKTSAVNDSTLRSSCISGITCGIYDFEPPPLL